MFEEFDRPAFRFVIAMQALTVSALVACLAGFLSWSGGANPANSVLIGGGAFCATLTMILGITQFIAKR